MKKSKYRWAERTIDGVSATHNGSRKTWEATGTTANAMGRLILKIFRRAESASLDASSQKSSGLEELWSPLRTPPADKRTIKVQSSKPAVTDRPAIVLSRGESATRSVAVVSEVIASQFDADHRQRLAECGPLSTTGRSLRSDGGQSRPKHSIFTAVEPLLLIVVDVSS
ncbi:unnamed protein product [Heligmosomoides polygyrus]|uniref:Uncharacterized protein n=1 Tax=Heligmosomoides polygyrus TaxID=6339 RepID=A0A183G4V5_HELPZ|nr:unnamed protein product [Heligmosomoides polygyrus]